jgi:hypothetical protein
MAWSFRKRIKIIPGIHLNIGKNGISTTISVRGASINIGKNGTYLNTGIPGTGVSYRQKLSLTPQSRETPNLPDQQDHVFKPDEANIKTPEMGDNIFSLDVGEITSQDMQGIKNTILASHEQRLTLLQDLKITEEQSKKDQFKLSLSYWLLYGFILKTRTQELKEDILKQKEVINEIKLQTLNTAVQLDYDFDEEMQKRYDILYQSFQKLADCRFTWDVTSENVNDRFTTRSAASASITRRPVKFKLGQLPDIQSKTSVMIWDNANGADLYFYPNFVVVWNSREHFAIVGYDELRINFSATRFIETEKVPSDTKIIDETWFKVNKNGTPDKRFKDNYKIPIVKYGELDLMTKTGLNERYLFSNYEQVDEFNRAFLEYQIELIKLDYVPNAL